MSGTQTLSQAATIRETYSQKRVDSSSGDGQDGVSKPELAFKAHPVGVKPSGNSLAASENSANNMGLFGRLPDETVLVLLEWLDSKSLLRVGASCRGLYAYSTCDQLWKDLFITYADFLFLTLSSLNFFVLCLAPPLPYRLRSRHGTLL
jgi:hypothetical protein